MSLTSYTGQIVKRCALGRAVASYDVNGCFEYVGSTLIKVLEDMINGEKLEIRITRALPGDHPLAGVDLDTLAPEPEERR
ncbi:MAG TPA: hypothetical protein VMY78_02530 [Solirubrobacteraceae bacterium]|nr:hypothetical protein [Solirubrobacteraceae bacterium]